MILKMLLAQLTLNKGDKVIYESDGRGIIGTVTDLHQTFDFGVERHLAEVEWDNPDYFPRRMKIEISQLKKIQNSPFKYINYSMLNCECGLKYCRDGGNHSTWCPLYTPER